VLAPVVLDETGTTVGAVALSRPTTPLDHRITALWLSLGAVSAAGLLAAALIATALARWVSRPLSQLESAAQRLGDGALQTRSPLARIRISVRYHAASRIFTTSEGFLNRFPERHWAGCKTPGAVVQVIGRSVPACHCQPITRPAAATRDSHRPAG
jgi:HAMP domain-containing protein